jgi:hypothetical protein
MSLSPSLMPDATETVSSSRIGAIVRRWVVPVGLVFVSQGLLNWWAPTLYFGLHVLINLIVFALTQVALARDWREEGRGWRRIVEECGGPTLKVVGMLLVVQFTVRHAPPAPTQALVTWAVTKWDETALLAGLAVTMGGAIWVQSQAAVDASRTLFRMMVRMLFVWWCLRWIWLGVGDAVLEDFAQHPAQATVMTAVLGIMMLLLRWVWPTLPVLVSTDALPSMGMTRGRAAMPATDRDRQVVAVHEAGHALVYAALHPAALPASLKAEVRLDGRAKGVHGWVLSQAMPHQLLGQQDLAWLSLLDLAGMAAEQVVLGQAHEGNQSDQAQWLTHITQWLTLHPTEVFYAPPATDAERDLNQRKLDQVRAAQWSWLVAFLTAHRPVLESLQALLLSQPTLDAEALRPFLAQVTWPADGPRPSFTPEG